MKETTAAWVHWWWGVGSGMRIVSPLAIVALMGAAFVVVAGEPSRPVLGLVFACAAIGLALLLVRYVVQTEQVGKLLRAKPWASESYSRAILKNGGDPGGFIIGVDGDDETEPGVEPARVRPRAPIGGAFAGEPYQPCARYDADGDQIEVFFSNEEFIGRPTPDRGLTLYIGEESGAVVGCVIDGARAFIGPTRHRDAIVASVRRWCIDHHDTVQDAFVVEETFGFRVFIVTRGPEYRLDASDHVTALDLSLSRDCPGYLTSVFALPLVPEEEAGFFSREKAIHAYDGQPAAVRTST